MPIVGVIRPDHDERKAHEAGRLPKWDTTDHILEEAMHAGPKWSPWSYELLKGAFDGLQERGDNISTTAITSACPRSAILERREDYIESVDGLWRAFRGTLIHSVLERASRPNSLPETRFFTTIDGDDVLSGKPDLVTADGTIWDYKNTKKNPTYDYMYQDHNHQLQINRWLVNNATHWEAPDGTEVTFDPRKVDFKHLVIMYLDIDGPKPLETVETVEVPTGPGAKYPTKKVKKPNIWTDEQVRAYMLPRFRAFRTALECYPKWPVGAEELWGPIVDERNPWICPGYPYCKLKSGGYCLASRLQPNGSGLTW